jgi:Flp pilus assembly pilin Flp
MNRMLFWQVQLVAWMQGAFSRRDERGASLVEYVLLLTLIAVAAIGALTFLSGKVNSTINNVANTIAGP